MALLYVIEVKHKDQGNVKNGWVELNRDALGRESDDEVGDEGVRDREGRGLGQMFYMVFLLIF